MNYNITIEVEKIPGARVREKEGRRYLIIPVDNDAGTLIDSYSRFDWGMNGMVWKPLKGVRLNLTAIETRDVRVGTHFLKPALTKEAWQKMTDEERRGLPIVGSVKQMPSRGGARPAGETSDVDDLI